MEIIKRQMLKMRIAKRDEIANILFLIGFDLVAFIFILSLIVFFSLLSGFGISKYFVYLSMLITSIISRFLFEYKNEHKHKVIAHLLLLAVVFSVIAVMIFISKKTIDISSDSYHTSAVYYLINGWNPVGLSPAAIDLPPKANNSHVSKMAKGAYFYRAPIVLLANSYEVIKASNFILISACYLLIASFLTTATKFRPFVTFIYSFVIAFNPISMTGMLSSYTDSDVTSIMIIVSIATTMYLRNKESIKSLLLAIMGFILLIWVKPNGLVYSLTLSGVLLIFNLLYKDKRFNHIVLSFFLAGLIAILTIGYSSYIGNILRDDPLYPATLTKRDMQEGRHGPPIFNDMNRFERMFYSLFSKSHQNPDNNQLMLKMPFTIQKDELKHFKWNDVRIGGLGPLFGGALVISSIALMLLFIDRKSFILNDYREYTLMILISIISIFATDQAWASRYSPQIFLIPIMITCAIDNAKKRIIFYRLMNVSIITTLSINIILIGHVHIYSQYQMAKERKNQIALIDSWPGSFSVISIRDIRDQQHISLSLYGKINKPMRYISKNTKDTCSRVVKTRYNSEICLQKLANSLVRHNYPQYCISKIAKRLKKLPE